MWIKRNISDLIQSAVKTRPAVVVTGGRQVGKSSLLCRLFPTFRYISLDLPIEAEQAERDPESFLEQHRPPVIIDEVQYAPGLFRYLKVWIDRHRSEYGQFVLTSSQKFTLMKEVSESLAGRCSVLEMEGLSLAETLMSETWSYKTPASWNARIFRGGYPELWANPSLDAFAFYRSLTATYLERDLRQMLQVASLRDFERFLRLCALRTGQMLNKSELARDTGIKPPTANSWLSVLEAMGVVALLEPWFSNRSKSIVKTPKLYLIDSGLLCFLLNIKHEDEIPFQPNVGAIWETFVFSELRRHQMAQNGHYELYYYRDRDLEVDFVERSLGHFILREAKWTETPDARDFSPMQKVRDMLKDPGASMRVVARVPQTKQLGEKGTVESLID